MQVCKLPNKGLSPGAIPESLVSEVNIVKCFEKSCKSGFYLSECTTIPHKKITHLTQILDGHDTPLNNMLGKSLCRGLYAHFVLHKVVNWASFAEVKHRNKIIKALRDKKPFLDGPPIMRVDRAYCPRVNDVQQASIGMERGQSRFAQVGGASDGSRKPSATKLTIVVHFVVSEVSTLSPSREIVVGDKYQHVLSNFESTMLECLDGEMESM